MLEFILLTQEEFQDFSENHPLNSIYQSVSWTKVKSNWKPLYLGVKSENKVIAACLFLLRPIPFGFQFAYSPRGPLLNFNDSTLVHFFFKNCKKELRKRKVILGKFDPNFLISQLSLDEKNNVSHQKNSSLISLLKKVNCRHVGYTLSLKESIQPRIQLSFPLSDGIDERIPSKTRKKIRSSIKKEVLIKEENSHQSLAEMIEYTQNRHQIKLRNPAYFKTILSAFGENACVLSAYQQDILISSCLLVKCNNTTEILYSGYHDDYRKTDSTYLLRYHAIQWAKQKGCKQFNFGGVEGNLDDGLFMFKSSFNPLIDIYIGEFDLLTFPLLSRSISILFPLLKSRISM